MTSIKGSVVLVPTSDGPRPGAARECVQDDADDGWGLSMKLIAIIGATAAIVAAAPASIGLIGNPTFSEGVPVRVPATATLLDDEGHPTSGPSARAGEGADDHGGDRPRGDRTEPGDDRRRRPPRRVRAGDDHGGNRDAASPRRATTTAATADPRARPREAEAGDDHGGNRGPSEAEAGDDHGGNRRAGESQPGDDKSTATSKRVTSGTGGTKPDDDHGGTSASSGSSGSGGSGGSSGSGASGGSSGSGGPSQTESDGAHDSSDDSSRHGGDDQPDAG